MWLYQRMAVVFQIILLLGAVLCVSSYEIPENFVKKSQGHTNNWAVLVDTSRFWFNYRHVANVLSVYRSVKRLGIPGKFLFFFSMFFREIKTY